MSIPEKIAKRVNQRFENEHLKPHELSRIFDEEIQKENLESEAVSNVRTQAASIAARLRIEKRRAS